MKGARVRRIVSVTLLSIGGLITLLSVVLVVGAYREDAGIDARPVRTIAEVMSVSFDRTLVRYETPDGAVHNPPDGISYPSGLQEGQLVEAEYDEAKPDLVRVAGRGADLSLMPAGTLVLFTWIIVGPAVWWLRRLSRTPSPATT